jgi:xanthine/CO dehydrogenase XdhC/CoxF family maturation factor
MGKDPIEDLHEKVAELRAMGEGFAVATVIEVEGSASALTGSKAVFDRSGKNILGWVGGGCAERFIGEQSLEATLENRPRIVTADLDDEIFGLGIACGGKMRVFIEPIAPKELLQIDIPIKYAAAARGLASTYGWHLQINETSADEDIQFADVLIQMADEISRKRHTQLKSLREVKELEVPWMEQPALKSRRCVLLGRSRITESLERHLMLLDFSSRIETDYNRLAFSSDEIVIVAGHSPRDPDLVANALFAKSPHVAMVGSRKRSLEVIRHLNRSADKIAKEPLYLPAGVDIRARNPDEIALSIVVEILLRGSHL